MIIKWYGHSSFLIENAAGHCLLTDPFDASVGYPMVCAAADVVTISHAHHDHNCLDNVSNDNAVIVRDGAAEVAGFKVTSVPTCHDEAGGSKRGENRVFIIESDGLRIAHLGDLGHIPTREQYAAMGPVDILMTPVGGFYTIDAAQAWEITKALSPRVVIPMHYKTRYLDYPITTETPYLALSGDAQRGMREIVLSADTLPEPLTVYLPALYTEA